MPVLGAGGDACLERLEPQGLDVHEAAHRGVGGVEQLEAAVDQVPVDVLGADPAPDLVGAIDDHHVDAVGLELERAAQPGETRAHHDDVGLVAPTGLVSHAHEP